jgi:hypothetical protein
MRGTQSGWPCEREPAAWSKLDKYPAAAAWGYETVQTISDSSGRPAFFRGYFSASVVDGLRGHDVQVAPPNKGPCIAVDYSKGKSGRARRLRVRAMCALALRRLLWPLSVHCCNICLTRFAAPSSTDGRAFSDLSDFSPGPRLQDADSTLEATAGAFGRLFQKPEQFKAGCAICVLLEDQLLTNTQVRLPCKACCVC